MTTLLNNRGEKQYKVTIAIAAQDQVATGFALDLALLVAEVSKNYPGITLRTNVVRGTYLPQQRMTLAKEALKNDATHILWIDSDMRFPKDALIRLLDRDLPIVGANYPMRRPPIIPTATGLDGQPVFMEESAGGTLEVAHAGFGLILIDADVFRKMPTPWFALGYSAKFGDYEGEDVFFCRKARTAGFGTFLDLDLSKEIKHLGEFAYGYAHANVTRDAWLAQQAQEKK
jgi:hypothetical protein